MLGSIDWKWLIVGLLLAWFGIPMVQSFLARRRSATA